MSREDIERKVLGIIKETMREQNPLVNLQSNLRGDTGLNSLEFISIMMKLEGVFSIEIDDDEIPKMITVQDIVDYIEMA